jgi:subtilisin family serine protease
MTAPANRDDVGIGALLAAIFLGIWLVLIAVLSQVIGWGVTQVLLTLGLDLPGYGWPVIGCVLLVLGGVPALLLAVIPRHPAIRETGRAWSIGAGALALGSGLRAFPGTQNELLLVVFALLAGVAAWFLRRQGAQKSGNAGWAIVGGLLVLVPFLWVGALGGWLETLAAILAALALGALASSTMDSRFWNTFDSSQVKRVLLGGVIAGVALALIGAGAGGNGVQLLMLLVLPPLGFAAAALRHVGWLAALATLGPLAFFDPAEINLFLTTRDVPYWAALSAFAAWLVAVVLGLIFGLAARPLTRLRRPVAVAAAAVVAIGAGAVYFAAGQPGFYGNQLFVVLKDQASLAGIPHTTGIGAGRDARVTAVYQKLVEHAERTQAPLRRELDRWRLHYQPYYLVNAIMVTGGPETRAWLETRDDVDRVLLDQRLRPLISPVTETLGESAEPPSSPQWNLTMIGAPSLWAQGIRGSDIVIGGSDTGVDGTHPALAAGYRGGDDSWYDPWDATPAPVDSGGHGTHTIATAVGRQQVGVAPDAKWIACVNLDRNMASPSYYLDCMQFMLAPFPLGGNAFKDGRPARAPHILTNSWGCPPLEGCDATLTRPATDAFAAAGIAFVAAAGNEGNRCGAIDEPPALDPAALTVAAVNESRAVADFSSRGSPGQGKPNISAPGEEILSAMPGGTYGTMSGTSMATPHIAGVLALMWSANPSLVGDLDRTYAALAQTATPVSSAAGCGLAEGAGAGIADAPAATHALSR